MRSELTKYAPMRMRIYPLLMVLVSIALTACSAFTGPDMVVVKQAIAIQLSQAQAELTQQLYRAEVSPPSITVDHVKIAHQSSFVIDEQPAYEVEGTYDVTLTFSDHQVRQRQNPFSVYLRQIPDEKSWQLARRVSKEGEGDRWMMTKIQ
jgi:hypothetical protein